MTDPNGAVFRRGRMPAHGKVATSGVADLGAETHLGVRLTHHFEVVCRGPDGAEKWREEFDVKWQEEFDNLVVTTGRNFYLDTVYRGSGYTAANFVGLTDGTPTVAAGDTMASHGGWVEITAYTEGTRPALTMAAASGGSLDNSASQAVFSINGSTTVGGAFIATNSTKGGTTGTLIGAGAFTGGDRSVANLDSLSVTVTASLTSS